ncbi:hypothetical protein [Rahnella sikkimica]|uniref:Uncharacterized protein n=1 Tax=Rahnella sikkimica TaxID=1805933 RepID=A0A2L1UUA9_9GAMM|nr:hypothetical protein [Rahnella sikkimica]AVF36552.1 hypothetical protein BV494_17165 [Rahnella sikkimica]
MINNLDQLKYKVNLICKSMVMPFPFPKIYIDENDSTQLNLLCIPCDLIKNNSRFINNNTDVLLNIIELKKQFSIKSLYIEMDFNVVSLISLPYELSFGKDYFYFIEKQDLFKKILWNKKDLEGGDIVREVIYFMQLFDPKQALKLIQYIMCNKIFENSIVKRIFDGYIEKLDAERKFYIFNNFRYVRDLVLHKRSLDSLNIELVS